MSNAKKFAFFCIEKLPIKFIFMLNTYKTVSIETYLEKTRQICDRLAFFSNTSKTAVTADKATAQKFF